MTAWLEAPSDEEAQELLYGLGCTDGLPVVVPTQARVEAALAATPWLSRSDVLGVVPPRMGRATVESVAVSAVMAGCLPVHLPVVCAAVRAVCDPVFTLDVVQATTHGAAVLTIVNGADASLGLASGTGALGPGYRANASIGRAVRLVLLNAGGAHPGSGDMSTLGQPAKFTCCLAEAEDLSPFGPLAVARGVAPGVASVTVLAVEGPRQVMFVPVGDGDDAARLIEMLGRMIAGPGTLGGMGYRGSAAIVLSPLHASVLADAGMDRRTVCALVDEAAVNSAADVRRWHGYVRGVPRDSEDPVPAMTSSDHLLLAVAGGPGTYSAVLCGCGKGIGEAVTVTVRAQIDQAT